MQTYDPSERYVSSIFVVNCDTFKKMTTAEIHAIFRHRHILVEGVETSEMEFDLEGLGSLGSITLPRSMQGMSKEVSPKHLVSQ